MMHFKKIVSLFLGIVFILCSQPMFALATTYQVDPAVGPGIDPSTLETVTELVKSEAAAGGGQVVSPKSAADYRLKPKLLKLGEVHLFVLEKSNEGRVQTTNQLRVEKLDDLDTVISRVTKATLNGTEVRSSAEVSDVADEEMTQKGYKRKSVKESWSFRFGPTSGQNLNSEGLINLYGALTWLTRKDVSIHVMLDTSFSTQEDNQASWTLFGLGSTYYLLQGDSSPFVSADFGYGAARRELGVTDDKTNGFGASVSLGYSLLRTYRVNLEVAVRYGLLFKQNLEGTPSVLGLQVGMGF